MIDPECNARFSNKNKICVKNPHFFSPLERTILSDDELKENVFRNYVLRYHSRIREMEMGTRTPDLRPLEETMLEKCPTTGLQSHQIHSWGDQNKTVFDLLTKFLLKEATAADMASTTLSNLFSTIYSTAKHTA